LRSAREMQKAPVNFARRAAVRTTLIGLHVGAVFAGTECLLIWAAFRWRPAAIVGGLAYVVGGVLALLAYPRMFARTRSVILERGLRIYLYSMALITIGAFLARDGSRGVVVGRIKTSVAQAIVGTDEAAAKEWPANAAVSMARSV
jgi:hypothetical protein